MKYNTLVFLIALLGGVAPCVQAQQDQVPAEISWGPDLSEPAGSRITKVIDVASNAYYVLRQKEEGAFSYPKVFVEQYDNKQRLKRSVELGLKYKGKRRAFEDVVKIGGTFYFFTSFNNEAQRKNYLFYQPLNRRLQPARKLVKIADIPAANKARPGAFNLLISEDSSKVLLYSQLDNKKREPERFALRVFDNQLNPLWQRNITLPYSEQQFSVEDYRVDEAGNVYLLCLQYMDGKRSIRRGNANYQYVILAYTGGGERKKEYRIAIDGKFISDMNFRIGDDGALTCAGFYSEKGTSSVKGTCFFKVDPETEQAFNVSLQEFDFEFRTAFMQQGEQRRAERAEQSGDLGRQAELSRFAINDLILRSDGGAVIVAEQFFIFERTYRNYWDGILRSDFFYNYNDIIVVNIRPDGSMEWSVRIPKRQETVNDGGYFSSYAMAIVRDRIYFIFNDNSRNFGDDDSDRLYNFNGRNSIITLAEVRKNGELEMYPLYSNRNAGIITRPKICKQTGSRKMMIYGEQGRNYRFGLLQFP
mgnify:CR=1 FL=1